MSLKVAIISEKLGSKDATDSTIISKEAIRRGHKVFEIRPENVSFSENRLQALGDEYTGAAPGEPQERQMLDLERMDVIHWRPNPPVDMGYLTKLYLLNHIKDKVLIINNPEAIIKLPEKIFPLQFPEFIPPTLISSNIAEIAEFAHKYKQIVLKPIYDFGGNGVRTLKAGEVETGSAELTTWMAELKTPLIVQKFLPQVAEGDKRVFFVHGEIVGGDLRVPKAGEFRANTAWGSSVQKTTITDRDREFGKLLGPVLRANGIYLCGIDVIGDYVTEINITSPAGFGPIKTLYNEDWEPKLWEIIEDKVQ